MTCYQHQGAYLCAGHVFQPDHDRGMGQIEQSPDIAPNEFKLFDLYLYMEDKI